MEAGDVIDQPVKLGAPLVVVLGGLNGDDDGFAGDFGGANGFDECFFAPTLLPPLVVVVTETFTRAWSESCTFCPVGEVPVTEAMFVKPLETTLRTHW